MKRTEWVLVVAMCLLPLVGCAGNGRTTLSSTRSVGELEGADFGVGDWLRGVSKVETTALVTTYDSDGVARVTTQELTIRPRRRQITARCNLPAGHWTARVNLDTVSFWSVVGFPYVMDHGDLDLSDEQEAEIADSLRLICHRVCGPLNLIGGGERVAAVKDVFAAGHEMTRCRVTGRPGLASAYFFGDRHERLRLVTQGGWQPTTGGTVTVYRLMQTSEGAVLPKELEVSNLGENSLIGRKKILSVRLTNVRIHQ